MNTRAAWQNAAAGLGAAGTAVGTAAGIASTVASSLALTSAAANAVPIAGQVASAALAIGAALTMAFAGKGHAGKSRKRRDEANQFLKQRRANLQAQAQPNKPQQATAVEAPPTQGMGQFQEMQQGGQPPIYSSADPIAQPRTF